ncbi:MAG: TIGR01906 family membrane protein [Chloroflexi bacterium]|nr:TIGR01906 family membrane protein [Chloroflexota bacterium]
MAFVRRFSALLFIIAIPVALITTNIRVAANEPRLYEYAADHYDTPATTGIARSELLRASGELRDYFNNDTDTIFIRVQKDGAPISLFNPRETAHLRDVKTLFQASFRVQEATVLFALAYIVAVFIWAREGSMRTLARQIVLSGVISAAVVGVVGIVAVSGFERAFEQFHLIAFNNDLWKLNPNRDRLIQMFPQAFWENISLWVVLVTLVEVGVLAGVSGLYLRLTKDSTSYPLADAAQE